MIGNNLKFILKNLSFFFLNSKLKRIKLVVTDVDGVLTDSGIYLDKEGEIIRKFNVKDGLGIKLLQEIGIKVAFLSGGSGKSIISRANQLNVDHCMIEIKNKMVAIKNLQEELNIGKEHTLFIGDDLNDIPIKDKVCLIISPKDAVLPFKNVADYLLDSKGGEGAFRELVDMILKSKKKFKSITKGFNKTN